MSAPEKPLVSEEEMANARLSLGARDLCAHLLIPLNRCRTETIRTRVFAPDFSYPPPLPSSSPPSKQAVSRVIEGAGCVSTAGEVVSRVVEGVGFGFYTADEMRAISVVSRVIEGVGFGFYTADEVRAISVRRITNPLLFDGLRSPAAGGLYDPALGPVDKSDVCVTCQLGYFHCPGHFGHLELALPVYHPLLFSLLVKLLRCVCLRCHHLKLLSAVLLRRVCLRCHHLKLLSAVVCIPLCNRGLVRVKLGPMPVYHLLCFGLLVKLLRCAACACHHLKILSAMSKLYALRLALISQGRLREAQELGQKMPPKAKRRGWGKGNGKGKGEEGMGGGKGGAKAVYVSGPAGAVDDDEDEEEEEEEGEDGEKGAQEMDIDGSWKAEAEKAAAAAEAAGGDEWGDVLEGEGGGGGGEERWSWAAEVAAREVVRELWSVVPASKCQNCFANNPSVKREGHSKIFRVCLAVCLASEKPLALKPQHQNDLNGFTFPDVLAELAEAAASGNDPADINIGPDGELRSYTVDGNGSGEKRMLLRDDDDSDDDEMLAAAAAAKRKRGAGGRGVGGEAGTRRPFLMNVAEVEEHLRRLWIREPAICNALFGSHSSTHSHAHSAAGLSPYHHKRYYYQQQQGVGQQHGGGGGGGGGAPTWPSAFFLRCLLVPPNKFRPPNIMNDMLLEHAQNVFLTKILEANLFITQIGREAAATAAAAAAGNAATSAGSAGAGTGAEGEGGGQQLAKLVYTAGVDGGGGAAAEGAEIGATEVRKAAIAWLQLQHHVNCFLDSSLSSQKDPANGIRQQLERKEGGAVLSAAIYAGPSSPVPLPNPSNPIQLPTPRFPTNACAGSQKDPVNGIRQQLERKEGLFRMNMMGKRVNYACRSVISPDPYIQVCLWGVFAMFGMLAIFGMPGHPLNEHDGRACQLRLPLCHFT
ncbi:unnamed protein product [Closterium sp. NIES-65]|nr:unnamed protein product [Closterium sp. NIES-65]